MVLLSGINNFNRYFVKKNFFFFFNWDSLHARLNSHYEAWSYKKKSTIKITGYRITGLHFLVTMLRESVTQISVYISTTN